MRKVRCDAISRMAIEDESRRLNINPLLCEIDRWSTGEPEWHPSLSQRSIGSCSVLVCQFSRAPGKAILSSAMANECAIKDCLAVEIDAASLRWKVRELTQTDYRSKFDGEDYAFLAIHQSGDALQVAFIAFSLKGRQNGGGKQPRIKSRLKRTTRSLPHQHFFLRLQGDPSLDQRGRPY